MSSVSSRAIRSRMTNRATRSRLCSIFYPVPPYGAGKMILATYSGPMASLGSAIANMNAKIDTIMAMMAFNDDTGLSGYQFNYDYGTSPVVNIASGTILGGYTPPFTDASTFYSSLTMDSLRFPTAAEVLADLDSEIKRLQWVWLYDPASPVGSARKTILSDAYSQRGLGGLTSSGIEPSPWYAPNVPYDNLISVPPALDSGIVLTVGSVWKLPSPWFIGYRAFDFNGFGTEWGGVTGGQIYIDFTVDVTASGGAGGTGVGGITGAGGGGNQGP